ncbi:MULTISPECIES: hypothetical protein [Roseateles]|uniref:6-phosphogluconate dehydrogenase n=1 Tax=Pelomonas caseinilytica TaxID=2906763 RepID=A0ABS8XN46_9BURK|nr:MULTISPECIES: hypothetical protein [unclassified Roseateles]MCE4540241.1 hypothetical protein [Pelomonas sp. P7]HEV6966809.1 hypothetical protein [Roseateles sp.]
MRLKLALSVVALLLLITAWLFFAWHWSYSEGERAGWVQKLSRKGWICKTWEGEQALVSLPGSSTVEKFVFTVHDEATAQAIYKVMGRRVNLHYEEKVGLPGSCFGETRHFVTGVTVVDEISLSPGVVVPVPAASAASR